MIDMSKLTILPVTLLLVEIFNTFKNPGCTGGYVNTLLSIESIKKLSKVDVKTFTEFVGGFIDTGL
jgi:hypothetical protein